MIIPSYIKIEGMDKQQSEKEWNSIKMALDDIYKQRASGMDYRKLYEFFFICSNSALLGG